jgi:hypothetical protein
MGRERVIYVNISSIVKNLILNVKVNVRQYKKMRGFMCDCSKLYDDDDDDDDDDEKERLRALLILVFINCF